MSARSTVVQTGPDVIPLCLSVVRSHNKEKCDPRFREAFLSFVRSFTGCTLGAEDMGTNETGPLPSRKSGSTWKDTQALIC